MLSARVDAELPAVAMASGGMADRLPSLLVLLGASAPLPMHATFGAVTSPGTGRAGWCPSLGLSPWSPPSISYVTGIGAARILGARLSSFVGLTEVLFAVLIAWLVLGELPTAVQLAGGALIVAGVALVRLDESRRAPVEATEEPVPALR